MFWHTYTFHEKKRSNTILSGIHIEICFFISILYITYSIPMMYKDITSCRRLRNLENEIYDIGTKILYVQCLSPRICFCFVNPQFFSGMCRIFRDLAFGSIKTRFKGFWDIFSKICLRPWIHRYGFYWTFAPGGRLSYEAYNVEVSTYHVFCVLNVEQIFVPKNTKT